MLNSNSNKSCYFKLSIKRIHSFHKIIISSTTVSNIDNNKNVSWAANQYIRMISEGSCDTEDWSNDATNSALVTAINYILEYIQI